MAEISLVTRVRDAKRTRLQQTGAHTENDPAPAPFVSMVAPMVRYSKLPFRLLCRRFGADIAFTPMIVADTFNRSQKARDSEFSSHESDRPLVVQFAANDPIELGAAAEKCVGYADAIDINCGCPQRWAMADGLGAALMKQPQLIKEMVRETRHRSGLPCSVKIRVHDDIRKTIDLVQQVESVGVEWITVHGRTARERTSPVRLESIKAIKDIARVPIIANGDVFDPSDFDRIVSATGVDGLMSARGILSNPALFAGYSQPPVECLQYYVQLALEFGGSFPIHHHHLMCMLAPRLWKGDRTEFSRIQSMSAVIDFFEARGWWDPAQIHASTVAEES